MTPALALQHRAQRISNLIAIKELAISISLLLLSPVALAQQISVTSGERFAWEMPGPFELAKSYRYEVELDGQVQKDALTEVVCAVATPLVSVTLSSAVVRCSAPYPTSIPGAYRMRVRPVDISVPGLPAVEGPWMPTVYFVMRPVPPQMKPLPPEKPKGAS